MKESYLTTIGLTAVVLLLIGSWFWSGLETLVAPPEYASAATTSTVAVSASITAVISCSTATSTTAFGPLLSSAVGTSDPNASTTISCVNAGTGCTLYVKDLGNSGNPGLWNSTSSKLIASASSTLIAGTEGYGINATTTATGSGATLAIPIHYRLGSDTATSTVGGFTTSNQTLGNATATSSNREVVVRHKAAISATTQAGTYNDTITYECTENN